METINIEGREYLKWQDGEYTVVTPKASFEYVQKMFFEDNNSEVTETSKWVDLSNNEPYNQP